MYISTGGYSDREGAIRVAEEKEGFVAFGRYYIPNVRNHNLSTIRRKADKPSLYFYSGHTTQPDLPARIKKNIPLTPYDRSTFYERKTPNGYSDYSFADPEIEARVVQRLYRALLLHCLLNLKVVGDRKK